MANADIVVVVPAHSWPEYLPLALDSIAAQTVAPAQVLAILDAPTKAYTPETVQALRDSEVIELSHNVGPAQVRNIGFEWAIKHGYEWVAFLDEDDEYHPQYIEKMCRSRELVPWATIHYCDWVKIGGWNGYQRVDEYHYERLLQGPFIMSASVIHVKAWLDVRRRNGTGYDPELRGWEDWCFFLEAGALGHVGARVGLGLVRYRRHAVGQSISDEAHASLHEIVGYIREKMQRLYSVEITYKVKDEALEKHRASI